MTDIDWPASLPQYVLQQGYSEGNVDNVIKTTMMAGPQKRRLKSTEGYLPTSVQMHLTNSQKSDFLDFYKNTIAYGALPFNLPTYDGIVLEVFLESRKLSPKGGNKWQLSMSLTTLA